MVKETFGNIKDDDTRTSLEFLQEAVQQKVISLDAAPTATEPLLDADEIGIYSNKLYQRKDDVIYVYNSDSQITVT